MNTLFKGHVCLSESRVTGEGKRCKDLSIVWFTPQTAAMVRTGSGPSQEQHLGLPQQWQGSKHLGQPLWLSQTQQQGAHLEVEQLRWHASITGGSFSRYATKLTLKHEHILKDMLYFVLLELNQFSQSQTGPSIPI